MAQPMPESVKTMQVTMDTGAAVDGEKFDIKMDRDEVMIVLSLYWWWYGVLVAGANVMNLGLWRKSETLPAATLPWACGPDLIWGLSDSLRFVTESMWSGNHGHVIFPWPMVMIRPPQLVTRHGTMTSGKAQMRLYYLLRSINDVDLAKLMVKDHA